MAQEVEDDWAVARSLNTLSYGQLWLDAPAARTSLDRSIELGRSIGDNWAVADGLKMMTIAWMVQEGLDEVSEPLSGLLKVSAQLENKFFIAWCQFVVGFVALHRGEFEAARREFQRSLDNCHEVGDPATGGIALAFLGELDVLTGHSDAGRARFGDILQRADGSRAMGGPFALLYLAEELIGCAELDAAQTLVDLAVAAADLPLFGSWARCLRSGSLQSGTMTKPANRLKRRGTWPTGLGTRG